MITSWRLTRDQWLASPVRDLPAARSVTSQNTRETVLISLQIQGWAFHSPVSLQSDRSTGRTKPSLIWRESEIEDNGQKIEWDAAEHEDPDFYSQEYLLSLNMENLSVYSRHRELDLAQNPLAADIFKLTTYVPLKKLF